MKTELNFLRSKYGRYHISFVQFSFDFFIQVGLTFFYGKL